MPSNKPRFLVSRTYDVVTERSARNGESAESGYRFRRAPMSLSAALRELEDCHLPSQHPIGAATALEHVFFTQADGLEDYRTGDVTTESVHVAPIRGGQSALRRLYVLAGLI